MTDRSPVWHPFHQHGLGEAIPLVTHAEGAALYTDDGRRVIDAISSWWVTTHGHNHPRIMQAVREQTEKLDQLIFAGWTHEPAETLARGLVEIMPDGLPHVFFSDSGSTAVEVALKMALGFWHSRGEPRQNILVMEHSYHGDTIGAMSVGAPSVFNAAYEPLLFKTCMVPFPHPGNEDGTLKALDQFCRSFEVAAFIVEPLLLGAGGMLTYPPQVLAEMRAICARHDVLFIADEVMTGWGRTGTLLACEQANVTPDILCLAKGLTGGSMPLAVTMANEAIYQAHYSTDRSKMFFHSSSFTANPVCCAAANANLAIWREEPVLDRIAALSTRLGDMLARLSQRPDVTNARQCGTMVAFDVAVTDEGYLAEIGPRLRSHFFAQDVMLRPLGNTVYAMPPYCLSDDDVAQIEAAIVSGLDSVS